MKKIILTAAIAICATFGVNAQNIYGTSSKRSSTSSLSIGTTNGSVRYQQGYTRKDGTYVQGHYKTFTNTTNHDNFSTSGNINTFTGTTGTRARDSGRTIHTGSRGGQYYINSKGNKTYVPKRR